MVKVAKLSGHWSLSTCYYIRSEIYTHKLVFPMLLFLLIAKSFNFFGICHFLFYRWFDNHLARSFERLFGFFVGHFSYLITIWNFINVIILKWSISGIWRWWWLWWNVWNNISEIISHNEIEMLCGIQ